MTILPHNKTSEFSDWQNFIIIVKLSEFTVYKGKLCIFSNKICKRGPSSVANGKINIDSFQRYLDNIRQK